MGSKDYNFNQLKKGIIPPRTCGIFKKKHVFLPSPCKKAPAPGAESIYCLLCCSPVSRQHGAYGDAHDAAEIPDFRPVQDVAVIYG